MELPDKTAGLTDHQGPVEITGAVPDPVHDLSVNRRVDRITEHGAGHKLRPDVNSLVPVSSSLSAEALVVLNKVAGEVWLLGRPSLKKKTLNI